jgi:HTH-type transcriptional regulator, transcriptional repressor of NAD biosynthesis genes
MSGFNAMQSLQPKRLGKHGMILGKFLPPHAGHLYLIAFAKQCVEKLTVVVGSLASEPIPGVIRYDWIKTLFPDIEVLHLTDENPQYPHEDPDFWRIWKDSLTRILPQLPDWVFASEDYGWPLAEVLGAQFMPVDPGRENFKISGSAIREKPNQYWEYLPEPVRLWYLKRVAVMGPESTGKSTLARNLAQNFKTIWVPEYARTWIEAHGRRPVGTDMPYIALGQRASQKALESKAQGVLFYDTELWLTTIWNQVLFQNKDTQIEAMALEQKCDHFLLCAPDVPWVADDVRYLPSGGEDFFERCLALLEAQNLPYTIISGTWEERWQKAIATVSELIN